MAAILQIGLYTFSSLKLFEFTIKLSLNFAPNDPTDNKSALFF